MSIKAASMNELDRHSCDWAFIDIGFAEKSKSCGALFNSNVPEEMRFADLVHWLQQIIIMGSRPLNLIIEAPLSVSFNSNGNPTGRSIERRDSITRYWYVGLGATVMVAATYLLRSVFELDTSRNIRLIEGLASFKQKGLPSSHANDVLALRSLAWGESTALGKIIPPNELKRNPSDNLHSAFEVSGMNFGIPPVVALGA